jgi:energy-coupling factor transporter ATP-binding protein EcfA2
MPPLSSEAVVWPLQSVVVNGMFGDRDLPIRLDRQTTVLSGQNGSGKSTLLRAVDFLAHEQWLSISELPLRELTLTFAQGRELKARLTSECLELSAGNDVWTFDLEMARQFDPDALAEITAAQRRTREPNIRRHREQRVLQERMFRTSHLTEPDFQALVAPEWLNNLLADFHTKFISARRLEHRLKVDPRLPEEEAQVSVVNQYADELQARMRNEMSTYAAESRQQEKNLPMKIVDAMQSGDETAETLSKDVDALQAEVRELAGSLAKVGLFYEEQEGPEQQFREYPRNQEPILLAIREVYRVTQRRLDRLTSFRKELEFFASFLNSRFRGKQVELNQEDGIAIVLSSGERIRPNHLSSGEQQLLALAYQLLFETEPHTVVLLDEPELSLHVAWLKGLINAFLEMADARHLQFVIATHSPSLLAAHSELERSLDIVE